MQDNPDSLIIKFFGIHAIKGPIGVSTAWGFIFSDCPTWHCKDIIYVVVMDNIFNTELSIDAKYDLKGT